LINADFISAKVDLMLDFSAKVDYIIKELKKD